MARWQARGWGGGQVGELVGMLEDTLRQGMIVLSVAYVANSGTGKLGQYHPNLMG